MFGIEMLEKYVEEKIADFGGEAVMEFLASTPVGVVLETMSRASEFIESDGLSELDRIASGEVKKLTRPLRFKFKGMDLLKKMQDSITYSHRRPSWQRGGWAQSRQDWLTNAWQHDWRSQPRNVIGEWVPGRLPYPVGNARAIGKGRPKTSRSKQRLNRYRRYGRIAARSVKWGDNNGS